MSNVKAIPDGYSTITPFLNVKGAAIATHKQDPTPEELKKRMAEAMKQMSIP